MSLKKVYNTLPKPEKEIFIYLLSDPDTNEPKYIGMTTIGFKRIQSHYARCFAKNKNKSYVKKWVSNLRLQNKIFKIDYLEYFDSDTKQIDEAEQFYITYFKFLGFKLINHENGGRWNGPLTEEQKLNISKRVKIQMSDPKRRQFLSDINKGNKNGLGSIRPELAIENTKKKTTHIIEEESTGTIFYGLVDLGNYLNCSESRIRNYLADEFEIDNKKFKVLRYYSKFTNKTIDGNRKNSYQIEDKNGNLYTSVKEAAEKIGCSYKALSHYVQGHTKTANGNTYKVYRHGILIKG